MPRGIVVRSTALGNGGAAEQFGIWTPVDFFGAVPFAGATARYSRIGGQVFVWGQFTINANVSAAQVLVSGLPFAPVNAPYNQVVGSGFGDPVRGYVYPNLDPSVPAFRLRNTQGTALTYGQLSGSGVSFAFSYRAA